MNHSFSLTAASIGLAVAVSSAAAQTSPVAVTIEGLLNQGFSIAAASSSGSSQFLYLQGADRSGRKKAYACQLQFGSNGGFQGCLALP